MAKARPKYPLLYGDLGQYPKALEFFSQALAIRKEIGDKAGEGDTLNNIGGVYKKLGQYPKALEFFSQALAIHKEIGKKVGEGVILNNIGNIYDNLGQTAAINRLKPNLKLLLAGKILQGLAAPSSDLQITGEIFSASGKGPKIQIASRGVREREGIQAIATASQPFRAGEAIRFKVENQENRELYLSCLAIDAAGNITVLYPANWDAPEEAARIDRNSSLVVPRPEDEAAFKLQGSGLIELLTMLSTAPLHNALRAMQTIARGRGVKRGFLPVEGDDPLEVVGNLLGDVEVLSRGGDARVVVTSTAHVKRSLDTNTLAAFLTVIQVE